MFMREKFSSHKINEYIFFGKSKWLKQLIQEYFQRICNKKLKNYNIIENNKNINLVST